MNIKRYLLSSWSGIQRLWLYLLRRQFTLYVQSDSYVLGTGVRGWCVGRNWEGQILCVPQEKPSKAAWTSSSATRDLSERQ